MEELKKIILELIQVFKELRPTEKTKMEAAASYNVVVLEEAMKKEQAAVLWLKGLDQKREALLSKNGWSGKTFRQILETLPEGEKRQLFPLFNELEQEIRMFSSLNEDTNEIIRTNLHVVESMTEGGFYNVQGTEPEDERHYTDRKA